jgi:hypothetical protein
MRKAQMVDLSVVTEAAAATPWSSPLGHSSFGDPATYFDDRIEVLPVHVE